MGTNRFYDDSPGVPLQESIRALQERTAILERHVQALQAVNAAGAARLSRNDQALEEDVKAARGIAPGKGDTASLIEMRTFIQNILNPDVYGCDVSREVRIAARRVLGIETKE